MPNEQTISNLKSVLKNLYSDKGNERVGFIRGENRIIEVPNISAAPMEGFRISAADIINHVENFQCWATWHTHPNEDSNLSGEDYVSFTAWPDLHHFVIGNDGVKCYKWDEDKKALLQV